MHWDTKLIKNLTWSGKIINKTAKEKIARNLAEKVKDDEVIGFGSGSTCYLAIQAIGQRLAKEHLTCQAIPTSCEVAFACMQNNIPTITLTQQRPDWYFDGADEVDTNGNLIKGRGGAMFKEKLLMACSPQTYIIVDETKLVKHLGEYFPIPIEIYPLALQWIEKELTNLGAEEIALRLATKKDGPVITENGNFILDTRFKKIYKDLEKGIKSITGVVESGLFWNYNIEVMVSESNEKK